MKPRSKILAFSAVLIAWCGAAPSASARETLRPSDLNKNAQKYDRSVVVVEGVKLMDGPNSSHLNAIYNTRKIRIFRSILINLGLLDSEKHPDKACITIDNPDIIWEKTKEVRHRHVIVRGIYLAEYDKIVQPAYDGCSIGSGILINEVIEIR